LAVSISFLYNKTRKGRTLNAGCISETLCFHKENHKHRKFGSRSVGSSAFVFKIFSMDQPLEIRLLSGEQVHVDEVDMNSGSCLRHALARSLRVP